MKMNFGYFHIQKIISQTVWTKKVYEKNGSLVQFACDLGPMSYGYVSYGP